MLAFTLAAPSGQSGSQDCAAEMCIQKIAAGDREALAALYEQTHAAVYGFALSILKNAQDAEDVLQDTYIQVWKAAENYVPAGKPLAWIFTITRNLARMCLRKQNRVVPVAEEDWPSLFAEAPAVVPEEQVLLAALFETLSEEESQIVVLHAVSGMKHREIAELLNLGLPTVLSKYNRALKKLRRAQKEADGYDKS